MRVVARRFVLFGAVVALIAASAATAQAATIVVEPGESIQAAVNRADAGDVIIVRAGVYRQSVKVDTPEITLRGAGDSRDGSVIKHNPSTQRCNGGSAGICVVPPASDTTIRGFRVRGFEFSGVAAFGTENVTFRNNSFVGNVEYGAAAFGTTGTRFIKNFARGAEVSGFYLGDSRNADAVLRDNVARRSGEFGFFIRDAADGLITGNRARANCVGFALINTGSPGRVFDWTLSGNRAIENNDFCPGGEGDPQFSGTGIGLFGAQNNRILENVVLGNEPARGSAFAPGGIVLVSSEDFGGSPAGNNRIAGNRVLNNRPFDLFWDEVGSGNVFNNNTCDRSRPPGLCN
jgi:nitrous oxidase accessory protein NosD